jgi:N-acetylmuramoyl-L-alanine amidase
MPIKDLPEMKNIADDDVFTIVNHMVHRNGKPVPFISHDKRSGRAQIDVKFFVYHYTAGRYGIDGTVNYMKNQDTKADVHLVLDTDGRLVQMAPLNEKCWHAGQSSYDGYNGLNSYSCGVEVINPGPLEIIEHGVYKTWYGDVYYNPLKVNDQIITARWPQAKARPDIVERTHHMYLHEPASAWIPYSKEQINVMTNLSQAICHHYDSKLVGHDEITSRKRDPGPLSGIDRMREMIAGRDNDEADEPINFPPRVVEDEPAVVSDPVNTTSNKRGWFSRLFQR